jgi:uncharacterized membrane protein
MKQTRRSILVAALLAAAACLPAALQAQTYTTIDYPGAASTGLRQISARGDLILGNYTDDVGYTHVFLLIDGRTFAGFDCVGATMTRAYSMNSKGEAVGQYRDTAGVWHGFYLNMALQSSWEEAGARCVSFDPKGSTNTTPYGISEAGEIAGAFIDAQNNSHAFLKWGETILVFDLVDSPTNGALAITPQGDPLGHLQAKGERMKGWFLTRKGANIIEFPPAENNNMSCPFGVNSKGDIVGHYQRKGEPIRGFVFSGGKYVSFEVPDATATNGNGINDDGVIVGGYTDKNNKSHGFILRR